MIAQINQSGADIVWVGLGTPKKIYGWPPTGRN